jgi:hypothetical protein
MDTKISGKQMCEAIARWQKAEFGRDLDPKRDIWEAGYSSGELFHVWDLYAQAEAAGYGVAQDA